MTSNQSSKKIRDAAKELDDAVEQHDIPAILACFVDDCRVELFGRTFQGKIHLEKALRWLYDTVEEIRFEPITILINDEVFFEEFIFKGRKNKTEINIKGAEVLIYTDDKVKTLRLYLDGLQVATAVAKGFLEKSILQVVNKKILPGLDSASTTTA
jgi:hypothetical protein